MRPREENLLIVTYLTSSCATLIAKSAWSSLLSLFATCLCRLSHRERGFIFPSLESELAYDLFWLRECGGRGRSRVVWETVKTLSSFSEKAVAEGVGLDSSVYVPSFGVPLFP